MPDHLSAEDAVFFNPLGAGMDWGVRIAGTQPGDTVVIFGPGQRGLACLLAAREAGARNVIVVGRGRRPARLDLALSLGADAAINSDRQEVVPAVLEAAGGPVVDRVIDTTPSAVQPLLDATGFVRPEATIVVAAHKAPEGLGAVMDAMLAKALILRGAYSVSEWAKVEAIRVLSEGRYDLTRLHSHTFPIEQLDVALRTLGGELDGDRAMHITVTPH
jgi:threonine dehydrogenase-like Zn-dependent dehydrogenase